MADTRTVGDAVLGCTSPDETLYELGIDPDMPFEDFTRWLRYGKKADVMARSNYDAGWNGCLAAIKGDQ